MVACVPGNFGLCEAPGFDGGKALVANGAKPPASRRGQFAQQASNESCWLMSRDVDNRSWIPPLDKCLPKTKKNSTKCWFWLWIDKSFICSRILTRLEMCVMDERRRVEIPLTSAEPRRPCCAVPWSAVELYFWFRW